MAQEIELKLALHPDDLDGLLAHPLLLAHVHRLEELQNTYFDTPALALLQQRLAVRERQNGERTLLTVKTAGSSSAGLSQRGEWEAPTTPGQFDFAALVDDAELAQQLTRLAWQLVPVFRTDFKRRCWLLSYGGAQIELALDQGFIVTGAAPAERRQPILELELELLGGPAAALVDLAHTLALGPQGQARSGLRLHPIERSKAERGYALYQSSVLKPLKARALQLSPEQTPLQAFCSAALECLSHLQANSAGLLLNQASDPLPPPEFAHQARVALRRLRSGLRLFGPELPRRFVLHWSLQWKHLASLLGEQRNWDVFATECLPGLQGASAPLEIESVAQWAERQRRAAAQRSSDELASSAQALRLLAFMHAVLSLQQRKTKKPLALAHWAREQLALRHQRLRRAAKEASQLGPQGRHELRLKLKQLRYAQEFLSSLLPPKQTELSTAALAGAQELLGRLNDISTAQALLDECPLPAAAALHELLQARLEQGLLELPALERQLAQSPLPWD
ncbi:CYTH and CHAD domain-containing protein [Hydrogenophaga sp.]|uniref:CYTH and CHAD domain-containing protein n=1 Tax=Hydrogenophaga sp. TaxID=1904254 RepID=UPI0019937B20|nr:CYTH and CHAD domain-containing protein [Hydrogenophaga sp.]MBD3894159.1 CYTH and CHAD domain-containing protein [Hydrogenophaga sp.]